MRLALAPAHRVTCGEPQLAPSVASQGHLCTSMSKRQMTAAVQNLADPRNVSDNAPASWTAAVPCRFRVQMKGTANAEALRQPVLLRWRGHGQATWIRRRPSPFTASRS